MNFLMQAACEAAQDGPYPLADLFQPGETGFIWDGSASRFWTTSAAATECTTPDADPVGKVEDMSGLDAEITQATSAARTLYKEAGGIKSAVGGTLSDQRTWMDFVNSADLTEQTIYLVFRHGGTGLLIFSSLIGFDADNYYLTRIDGDVASLTASIDGVVHTFGQIADRDAGASVVRVIKTGIGANEVAVSVKDSVSFTGMDTDTVTDTTTTPGGANGWLAGFPSLDGMVGTELAFALFCDTAFDAGRQSTVEAHILAEFGSW